MVRNQDSFCPNIIPEWLPLFIPSPYVVPLINGNTKPLPVLQELPYGYRTCFHIKSSVLLATLPKWSAFVLRMPLPRTRIKLVPSLERPPDSDP